MRVLAKLQTYTKQDGLGVRVTHKMGVEDLGNAEDQDAEDQDAEDAEDQEENGIKSKYNI
jgi:hypothetical protein